MKTRGWRIAAATLAVLCLGQSAPWAQLPPRPQPGRSLTTPPPPPPPTGVPGTPPGDTPGAPPTGLPSAQPPGGRAPTPPPRLPRAPQAASAPTLPGTQANTTFEQAEVIVLWRDARRFATDYAALLAYRSFEIEQQNLIALGMRFVRYRFADETAALDFRNLILASYPAALPERNWQYEALGDAGTNQPRLFASARIGQPPSLASFTQRIGMLDTGVTEIAALQGSTLVQRSFTTGYTAAPREHGTTTAALIAGRAPQAGFAAAAHGATLHAGSIMRMQGSRQDTTTAMLLTGLNWLLESRVRAINLSLGGPGDALLRLAVERCLAEGVPLIAAAGNGGPEAAPVYPAAYPGVIAVTASDAADGIYASANRGSYILLTAPGVDVWAPGEGGGRYHSGTSIAAAITTGVVVRMQARRARGMRELAGALCQNAQDIGPAGRDTQSGCGMLRWPP